MKLAQKLNKQYKKMTTKELIFTIKYKMWKYNKCIFSYGEETFELIQCQVELPIMCKELSKRKGYSIKKVKKFIDTLRR